MRVTEIMTRSVHHVSPTTSAADAWELMQRKRIRHLVVIDRGEVRGILSSRDVGAAWGARRRESATVADLMSGPVVVAGPDSTVRRIANVMRGRSIGCVPIVDDGRLVGIVTSSDLLELIGRGIDRPAAADRRGLHHRVPHRKAKTATGVW